MGHPSIFFEVAPSLSSYCTLSSCLNRDPPLLLVPPGSCSSAVPSPSLLIILPTLLTPPYYPSSWSATLFIGDGREVVPALIAGLDYNHLRHAFSFVLQPQSCRSWNVSSYCFRQPGSLCSVERQIADGMAACDGANALQSCLGREGEG